MISAFFLLLSLALLYGSFQHTSPPVRVTPVRLASAVCAAVAALFLL